MPWVVTLTILVASAFLMDMSFTMITPFLPVYLSSALGAKASEVDMWSGGFCSDFLCERTARARLGRPGGS